MSIFHRPILTFELTALEREKRLHTESVRVNSNTSQLTPPSSKQSTSNRSALNVSNSNQRSPLPRSSIDNGQALNALNSNQRSPLPRSSIDNGQIFFKRANSFCGRTRREGSLASKVYLYALSYSYC